MVRDESEGGSEGAAGEDEDGGGVLSAHAKWSIVMAFEATAIACRPWQQLFVCSHAGITKNVF